MSKVDWRKAVESAAKAAKKQRRQEWLARKRMREAELCAPFRERPEPVEQVSTEWPRSSIWETCKWRRRGYLKKDEQGWK